jgi:hypothetical protein
MKRICYPWLRWMQQPKLCLQRGRDYYCFDSSMAQQVRNAARSYGMSARVVISTGKLVIELRPKKRVGGQPSLLA